MQPCGKLNGFNHYCASIKNDHTISEFTTERKVEFQKTPFGQTFFTVRRKKGKFSCYDIFDYQGHYWIRLGYRERIFNTSVRLIYHFLNKKFFFGEIYFPDISKVNPHQIAQSLLQKYTQVKVVPQNNFRIVGPNGFIFFENTGLNLSIKYIHTEDPKINQALEAIAHYNPFSKEVTKTIMLEDFI